MRNLNRFLNLTLVLAFGMLIMVHFASAQATTPPACGTSRTKCQGSPFSGATACTIGNSSTVAYCCNAGETIVNGACTSTLAITAVAATTSVPTTTSTLTTVCPTGAGVTYDDYEKCIISSNGLDKISGNDFFSSLSVDSLISAGTTILLAIIVIVLTIKIVLAAFKWVNNDAQDKNKKEAIKSITNGVVGLVISFSAYFVVIIIRAFFSVDGQLVNCGSAYFSSYDNLVIGYNQYKTGDYADTTDDFKKCMKTAGQEDLASKNFVKLINFIANCRSSKGINLYLNDKTKTFEYINSSQNDSGKVLKQCFVDAVKSLK